MRCVGHALHPSSETVSFLAGEVWLMKTYSIPLMKRLSALALTLLLSACPDGGDTTTASTEADNPTSATWNGLYQRQWYYYLYTQQQLCRHRRIYLYYLRQW